MRRLFGVAVAIALVACFSLGTASAQQAPTTFTLQPGGKAVVSFQAFCIEFGKVFPNGIQGPSGLAPDAVRGVISYGVGKGYNKNEQQALQLQYGIWQALGTQGAPQGDATAQEVVTNGKTAPANPQGTSVLDAFNANQVKVTLNSWAPVGAKVAITPSATDNFYGQGQLTVENTSKQTLTLYMPLGTQFAAIDKSQQSVAAYATNVQVSNPQQTLPNTAGEEIPFVQLLLIGLTVLALGLAMRSMQHSFS